MQNINLNKDTAVSKETVCPVCGSQLTHSGGCEICLICGWSACDLKGNE